MAHYDVIILYYVLTNPKKSLKWLTLKYEKKNKKDCMKKFIPIINTYSTSTKCTKCNMH